MTGAIECRYYGRDFTTDEMVLLRALIAADPQPTRAARSREFCRRIRWIKPDGGLKDMMARVTMLAMHRDGVIALPPPKGRRNPRFLIPPWIEIPNLGSHILALVRRRLPQDWAERYNTAPVLIETFIETPRYTGAVYRASGWIHVGTTQGRGRYDRDKLYDKPRKDIWLRPLRRDWRRTLNR